MNDKDTHVEAVKLLDKFAGIVNGVTGSIRKVTDNSDTVTETVKNWTEVFEQAHGVATMVAEDLANYLEDLVDNAYNNADADAERIFGKQDAPVQDNTPNKEDKITYLIEFYGQKNVNTVRNVWEMYTETELDKIIASLKK